MSKKPRFQQKPAASPVADAQAPVVVDDPAVNSDESQVSVDRHEAEAPTPSQAEVNEIREEAVTSVAEPKTKSTKAAKVEAPYPSQADLNAMREGKFNSQNREVKAEGGKAEYKTR